MTLHQKLFCVAFMACVLPLSAQNRKPGLWEVTTNTTHQQPAMMPPATTTTNVCVTQAELDKNNAVLPQVPGCTVDKVVKTATGMTGAWTCSGRMTGTGTVTSTSTDGIHATTDVHFSGTVIAGPRGPIPFETTSHSTSVYKGPDCGSVKPAAPPTPPAAH